MLNSEITTSSECADGIQPTEGIITTADFEDLDQPLVLYKNRKAALAELNNRFKYLVPLQILYLWMLYTLQPNMSWLGIATSINMAVVYVLQRRACLMSILPVAELTRESLKLNCNTAKIEIPWSEIKEVRAHRFLIPMIGIVPFDTARTARRGSFHTRCAIWSSISCTSFYRLFGVFVAPIDLFGTEFPLSAEDFAEQIEKRRQHALAFSDHTASLAINHDHKSDE